MYIFLNLSEMIKEILSFQVVCSIISDIFFETLYHKYILLENL